MKPFSFYKHTPLARIENMQFSMMSEKEIKENGVVHVYDSELNAGTDLDVPKCNGLNDARMFPPPISKKAVCRTDMNTAEDCPGYFGYMTLADAVYWPQHIDRIFETVRCVCINCSALLLEPGKKAEIVQRYRLMSYAKRYEQIRQVINTATKKACPYCKLAQPKYEKNALRDGVKMIYCKFPDAQGNLNANDPPRMMRPMEVQNVLRKITQEDAEMLGFAPPSRPEAMITKLFPVPPPCIRPASKGDGNQRSEDDLTRLLNHMLRHSEMMRDQKRTREVTDAEWDQKLLLLQMYVSAYVNNEVKGNKRLLRTYGAPVKSVLERLRGKPGRIRNNLMGKRVNYSARTVITGDPYLSVDEVGVPLQIAMHITFPEVVTPYNIDRLRKMVLNGPFKYPGAEMITSRDGSGNYIQRLNFLAQKNRLQEPADKLGIGMVVHRHLLNGDFVLFNRQPSLHRMSMMAHRVRVLPGKTFRLQLAVVKPYNADFDGDEMNLFAPQSPESVVELKELCHVLHHIISPRLGSPIIGLCQDGQLGAYLITGDDVRMTREQVQQLMMFNNQFDGVLPEPGDKERGLWTGKQVFSMLLPKGVNYRNAETNVVIENGQLISGRCDNNVTGPSGGGVIQMLYNDISPQAAVDFMNNAQFVVNHWLTMFHSFSVGIQDCVLGPTTQQKIDEAFRKEYGPVMELLRQGELGIYQIKMGKQTLREDHEAFVKEKITAFKNKAWAIVKPDIQASNAFMDMKEAGSKGKQDNLEQIMACLGQQTTPVRQEDGSEPKERIPYNTGKIRGALEGRTLPHFHHGDNGPKARGFCANSYNTGLSPEEFYFHCATGRDGLIDTALKSVTGDTPIVIQENGQTRRVPIGDWIDQLLKDHPERVEHQADRNMELLRLDHPVHIPTTDDAGQVSWAEVTHVTRHDPGHVIYEVTTASGRHVKVVESKSLIVWDEAKAAFVEKLTSEIQPGDCLPTTETLAAPPTVGTEDSFELGVTLGQSVACGSVVLRDDLIAESNAFVMGVLSGYVTAKGRVTEQGLELSCASAMEMEGLSMLFNRVRIFATMSSSLDLVVRAPWARRLAETIPLTGEMAAKLKADLETGADYRVHNDVVLDKIVEIRLLDVADYPKVYDLTVPSTLNFGLANGLQVRDTSETGYIQRKLVKVLEDHKVCHDGVVRNANADVIQISYGGDGFDTTKVEKDTFPSRLADMNLPQLVAKYQLALNDLRWEILASSELLQELRDPNRRSEIEAALRREFDALVAIHFAVRDRMKKQFANNEGKLRNIVQPFAWMPFRIDRVVPMVRSMVPKTDPRTDLSPAYVVEKVEELIEKIVYRGSTATTVRDIYGHTRLFVEATLRGKLTATQCIFEYGLNRAQFDRMIQMMEIQSRLANVAPGEMVGIIAAQSIGEPSTQFTLNSVEWNTELLIRRDGQVERVRMGEWIDQITTDADVADQEMHPNDTMLVHLRKGLYEVPSCDEDGNIVWKRIEAVTRHPPINTDGTSTLLKVTTHTGREVIATKAKSFLKRVDNKIVGVNGDELHVGDYLPVAKSLDVPSSMEFLDCKTVLPPTEFVYGEDVQKALNAKATGNRSWWSQNQGKTFQLPFKRGDTFMDAYKGAPLSVQESDGVRCLHRRNAQPSVPQHIPLDESFGFLCGAYLAEGTCTDHALLISNNDPLFLGKVREWLDRYEINEYTRAREVNNGISTNLRATSTVLAQLVKRMFGTGSENKRIPAWLFNAPDVFWKGLLNGYFSGDGYLPKKNAYVTVTSVSRGLVEDIQQGLAKFGITSSISACTAAYELAIKKYKKVHMAYILRIQGYENLLRLSEITEFVSVHKQEMLERHVETAKNSTRLHSPGMIVPDVITKTFGHQTSVKLDHIKAALEGNQLPEEDRTVLQQIVDGGVFYDRVTKIEEVESEHPYVYDLTVEDTRNFNIYNGLAMRDTFHSAGLTTKFTTTTGVKRLKELLEQTKSIKSPKMLLYFRDPYRRDRKMMDYIQTKIANTRIRDLVDKVEVLYDPSDAASVVERDVQNLHTQVRILRALEDAMSAEGQTVERSSEWVLRIVFNEKQIHQRRIHLWEIEQKLRQEAIGEISKKNRYTPEFLFSDTNAQELVLRVRLMGASTEDEESREIIARLKSVAEQIQEVSVRGLEGIRGAFLIPESESPKIYKEADDGSIVEDGHECVILTEGVNFQDLCLIPGIDLRRTVTNDVIKVYDAFGIEATRAVLLKELENVFSDISIHHRRHLDMLVDTMTFRLTDKNRLMTMNRIGVRQSDATYGPLAKASFEEMSTHFVTAAVHCDTDNFRGVSANVMAGQIFPGGTGMCRLVVDEERLQDFEPPIHDETTAPVHIETPTAVPELLTDNDILESMGGIL